MINLLITGGAGFIGSNFARHWIKKNPEDNIVIFDKLTYAGNKKNIEEFESNYNFSFVQGDITDSKLLELVLRKFNITHIANFAAETHVDRSINSPIEFIKTNIFGTYSLLNCFKEYWEEKGSLDNYRFLHISTDEVFGSLGIHDKPFNENSPYYPRSPYSASKASSDHLIKAWHSTYGLPVMVSNCSNNFGPYHYPEKLIPLAIINILIEKNIPIYGNGSNIRDWLYVEDHCSALEMIIKSNNFGESFCIGGSNELSNIEIIKMICNSMDKILNYKSIKKSQDLIRFVPDRLGHDFRYSIDSSKLKREFNWERKVSLQEGINKTINWYIDNKSWWEPLLGN